MPYHISYNISYYISHIVSYIIPYLIITCHIISYHVSHIIYHTISYSIIYHAISYIIYTIWKRIQLRGFTKIHNSNYPKQKLSITETSVQQTKCFIFRMICSPDDSYLNTSRYLYQKEPPCKAEDSVPSHFIVPNFHRLS